MAQAIRDALRFKDDAKVQNAKLPAVATMSREEAVKHLYTQEQEKAYELRIAAKCIQPCMTNMDSPAVSQKEADCLTNCTSKGMETYVWFKYMSLTQPGKMPAQ